MKGRQDEMEVTIGLDENGVIKATPWGRDRDSSRRKKPLLLLKKGRKRSQALKVSLIKVEKRWRH